MPTAAKPFRLTPPYDLLIRGTQETPIGLYQLQVATAGQLCRLHYKMGSLTAIKARLKTLTDQGYVLSDSVPTKRARSPYYYTLSQKGAEYLKRAGVDLDDNWRPKREVTDHSLYLEHTLELNDIIIAAAHVGKVDDRFHLEQFIHERVLKRQMSGQGEIHTRVIPDAFLDLRFTHNGRQLRMPVLLEHDRGSEEQVYFRKKIRAYLVFLRTKAYESTFGASRVAVCFTTFEGQSRLDRMLEWTEAEIQSTNTPLDWGSMFRFTSLTPPLDPRQLWFDPVWVAPFHREQAVALLT